MKSHIGACVLYVLPIGPQKGEARPAILIKPTKIGEWSLHVFCEPDDSPDWTSGSFHVANVSHSPRGRLGTWRWPPAEGA